MRLAFWLVMALAGGAAAPSWSEVTPPRPLWAPELVTPVQAAVRGVVPEASVRVAIDACGKVETVEVRSISPSTEYDAELRRLIVATISTWRYVPQRRDGTAEPAILEWKVRFPPASSGAARAVGTPAPSEVLLDGVFNVFDAEKRRSLVLAIAAEERLALQARGLKQAQALLLDPRFKGSSPRFAVSTDTSAEMAQALAGNFEATYGILERQILPGLEPVPNAHKVGVVAFRDRRSLFEVLRLWGGYETSDGTYDPLGLIGLWLGGRESDEIIAALLHETTHAYLDRHVVRTGVALPRWFSEGLAEYVSNSQIRDGKLIPGKNRKSKLRRMVETVAQSGDAAVDEINRAKAAIRDGSAPSLEVLMGPMPEYAYARDQELYYATAWLFVHFLRHGGGGFDQRFTDLALYLAEGYPAPEVVAALYGPPAELQPKFVSYVRSF